PPGKPTKVSFTIQQPDGTPLTEFRRGPGPHTGVHLIYVRDDLAVIIHHHPPLGTNGKIVDTVTFPAPGPYHLEIDVYPKTCTGQVTPTSTCNSQLVENISVSGKYKPQPLPTPTVSQKAGDCIFTLKGASNLTAIQAKLVAVTVTCNGK